MGFRTDNGYLYGLFVEFIYHDFIGVFVAIVVQRLGRELPKLLTRVRFPAIAPSPVLQSRWSSIVLIPMTVLSGHRPERPVNGQRRGDAYGPDEDGGVEAVVSILSVSMVLIFLSDLNWRSGQPAAFRAVFYPAMLAIVIAFDAYLWSVLRYGGPRIVLTVECSEETEYRICLDGKKLRSGWMLGYRGPIDDEMRCRKGRHVLTVESGGSVETAEVDVDEAARVRIVIDGGIGIGPDDGGRAQRAGRRLTENMAVLLYAASCFSMSAIAIVTILFNEIRSG